MDGRNFKILRTGDFCLRIINLVKPSIKCQWRTKAMSDLQVSKSYLSHPLFHKKLENVLHQNEVIDKQRISHKVPKTDSSKTVEAKGDLRRAAKGKPQLFDDWESNWDRSEPLGGVSPKDESGGSSMLANLGRRFTTGVESEAEYS